MQLLRSVTEITRRDKVNSYTYITDKLHSEGLNDTGTYRQNGKTRTYNA
jgi:hypothetical protein